MTAAAQKVTAKDVRRRIEATAGAGRFHVFLSHARDPDAKLAARLKRRLRAVGRRWWERRRFRVFLDVNDARVAEDLPAELRENLTKTHRLVLLASPASAASTWVTQEVRAWRDEGRPPPLLVHTGGTIQWNDAAGDFDFGVPDSALRADAVSRLYAATPAWIDVRRKPGLRGAIAQRRQLESASVSIAAAALGMGREELARHERRRQARNAFAASVAMLLVLASAIWATTASLAARQQEALRDAGQVAAAAVQQRGRLDLSLLLSGAAYRMAPAHGPALFDQAVRNPGLLRILPVPPDVGPAFSIAASPDGALLAAAASRKRSGGSDPAVLLWPLTDNSTVETIAWPGGGAATAVAFSPDSSVLAVGDSSGAVTLVTIEGRAERRVLSASSTGLWVEALSFSPDGQHLAIGREGFAGEATVTVVGPDDAIIAEFPGKRPVYAPAGDARLASISGSTVELRDATLAPVAVVAAPAGEVLERVAFSGDGGSLAAIAMTGTAGVFVATLPATRFAAVPDSVAGTTLAFGPGDVIATDSGVVTGATSVPEWRPRISAALARSVTFLPASTVYAVAGRWADLSDSGAVALYDAAGTGISYQPPYAGRGAAALSPDARLVSLVDASHEVTVQVADPRSPWRPPLAPLEPGVASPSALAFSPDSALLAGIRGRQLSVWRVSDGSVRSLALATPAVGAMPGIDHTLLSFNADGTRLAAVGPDGTVVIIDTTGGALAEAARLPDERQSHAVAFSPDGTLLAAAGPQGVVVWETNGWAAVLSLDSPVTAISFVGPRALAYSDGSRVVVRDLDSAEERQLSGPDDQWGQTVLLSAGPALSAVPGGPSFDAGTLAAVSAAGVVRLWDVGSAVRWDAAPKAPLPATALRLHPDGRSLTVAGASVTTWTIDPDYWLEWLCDVTGRNLTAAEWQTYGAGERPVVCPQYPVD